MGQQGTQMAMPTMGSGKTNSQQTGGGPQSTGGGKMSSMQGGLPSQQYMPGLPSPPMNHQATTSMGGGSMGSFFRSPQAQGFQGNSSGPTNPNEGGYSPNPSESTSPGMSAFGQMEGSPAQGAKLSM